MRGQAYLFPAQPTEYSPLIPTCLSGSPSAKATLIALLVNMKKKELLERYHNTQVITSTASALSRQTQMAPSYTTIACGLRLLFDATHGYHHIVPVDTTAVD